MSNLWIKLNQRGLGGLGWTSMVSWIELNFLSHHGGLNRKNYSTSILYACKISRKLKTNYYAINQIFKFQILI